MRSVRIFVSSPADAGHERDRLARVVARLNVIYAAVVRLELIRWEDEFYRADDTFQRQIPEARDCDVVIGLLQHRLGSPLPGDFQKMPAPEPFRGEAYASGTAYEILSSIAARTLDATERPDIYVFRNPQPPLVPAGSLEAEAATAEWMRLETFARRFFFTAEGEFRFAFHTFRNTDDFERQAEALLRGWIERNVLAGRRPVWPVEIKGSPFRALAAFDAGHSDVFFGREREAARAVEILQTLSGEQAAGRPVAPFLLVFGPSGAGKSSFARAGLAPALQKTSDGVAEWRVATMRPAEGGLDPFSALAARLFDDRDPNDPDSAKALPELRDGPFATPEALAALLRHADASAAAPLLDALKRAGAALGQKERFDVAPAFRLLIVVDQFDDLFAETGAPGERALFAKLLAALASSGAISVVATLRTGLYERLTAELELKALKALGATFELDPPEAAEIAAIVREPAAAAGLTFETVAGQSLDQRLLKDFDRPDMLPLLQFALSRLFEERRTAEGGAGVMTFEAYERMGGIAGAVQTAADRAMEKLGEAERARLPRLFRMLVEASATPAGRDASNQALALVDVPASAFENDPPLKRLALALVEERILVSGVGPTGEATVALSHRRVPELWTEAREAVAASAAYYRALGELRPAHRRWAEAGNSWKRLIADDVLLGEGRRLLRDFREDTPSDIADFVVKSQAKARMRMTAVSALAVVFFGLAVGAGYLFTVARDAEQTASAQRDLARKNLTVARETLDGVVNNVAEGLKDVEGMPLASRQRILNQVKRSVDDLAQNAGDDAGILATRWNVLISLGDAYLLVDDAPNARAIFDECQQIARTLAASGDPVWRRELSVSLDRVAEARARSGDEAGAKTALDEALAIRRALPDSPQARRDFSVSLEKLGDLLASRDHVAAETSYEESLAIRRALAGGKPDRDVAVSLSKIGDLKLARGDARGALEAHTEALAIIRTLSGGDETNTGLRRDLSVALDRVGEAKLRLGAAQGAEEDFGEARDIRARLVALDRDNAQWRRDLEVSEANLADVRKALASRGSAARIVAIPAALKGEIAVFKAGAADADGDAKVGRELADGDEVRVSGVKPCDGVKVFDGLALHALSPAGACRYVAVASAEGAAVMKGLAGLGEAFAADTGRARALIATNSRGDDGAQALALVDAVDPSVTQLVPSDAETVAVMLRHGASDFSLAVEGEGSPPSFVTRSRRVALPFPHMEAGKEGRIAVTDADGARLVVPFRIAALTDAPKPFANLPLEALVGDDRAAYGYWLLTSGGKEWSLFALSLLARAAQEGSARAEALLARLARGA